MLKYTAVDTSFFYFNTIRKGRYQIILWKTGLIFAQINTYTDEEHWWYNFKQKWELLSWEEMIASNDVLIVKMWLLPLHGDMIDLIPYLP